MSRSGQILALNSALIVASALLVVLAVPFQLSVLVLLAAVLVNERIVGRLGRESAAAAHAIVQAQEDERARIARDLHDEVNQALTGVLLRLRASAQGAPPELVAELAETQAVAAQAMGELRSLAHELWPAALDDHGLAAVLRRQVDDFSVKTKLPAELVLDTDPDAFPRDTQIVVYRVVQESLSNVARHAEASRVTVEVAADRVRVSDDGRGIAEASMDSARDGHGLAGMRERARQIGGRLSVRPVPGGAGTAVELSL